MSVPDIHLFSKSVKRYSSASKLKNNPRRQLGNNYIDMLQKRQYTLNPFVATTLNELGRYKIHDYAVWNCDKCTHYDKMEGIQKELSKTYGHSFSHLNLRKAPYKSGNPLYPCLIHDPQPVRMIHVPTHDKTIIMNNTNTTWNGKVNSHYPQQQHLERYPEQFMTRDDRYITEQYWRNENIDPQNNSTLKHSRYRNIQTLQSLDKKPISVQDLKDGQFKRKLKRLFQQADDCYQNIEKFSEKDPQKINIQPLVQIKNENTEHGHEYLLQIDSVIKKAQSGQYLQKPSKQSYFS